MSDDWQRWLTDAELMAVELSEHPAIKEWAKRTCTEREKLAKARGMLYSVKFNNFTQEEIDDILEETKE